MNTNPRFLAIRRGGSLLLSALSPRSRQALRVMGYLRAGRRAVSLGLVGTGLAAVLGLGLAVTHRPLWYRPASIDRSRLRADKVALAEVSEQISAALNGGRPVRVRLDESQLNRWLAARAEIWPRLGAAHSDGQAELRAGSWLLGGTGGPGEFLHDPQVRLLNGAIRTAATASYGHFGLVVSVTWSVIIEGDRIQVRHGAVRLGNLPVPGRWVLGRFAELLPTDQPGAVSRTSSRALGVLSKRRDGVVLRNEWVWPNGKRPFRLGELRICDGQLELVILPL